MQIIQILNDFIKVLYSPDFENISLADFMLVKDGKMCYLGQVVEITDDKFDSEKNIAKIKLMHTVNGFGDIVEYTRQLPNKHGEVLFANQREILNFINQDKTTVRIGEDIKTSNEFDLNLNFFENNAVVFCDKIADYNYIISHLARRLNPHKRIVIFDYTGAIRIPASRQLKAKIDFKLPLNTYTIDRMWQRTLSGASLETQSVLEEIFNEIKNYSKLTKDGFIPFNHFIKVITKQYKATPIKELLVLKNRLFKYQQEDIFANRKTDFKSAFEKLNTSRTTIIDMSNIKNDWQIDFMELVLRSIKTDSFVFLRINENNYDVDLYNYATSPSRQYKLIPAISHSFNKLPAVCESRYNYIITSSLNAKKDFGYFGNIISSLSKKDIMLLGEDTKNFAFIVKNIKIKENIIEPNNDRFEAKVTLEGDVIKNKKVKEKIESLKEQKTKEIENIVDGFLYDNSSAPTVQTIATAPKTEKSNTYFEQNTENSQNNSVVNIEIQEEISEKIEEKAEQNTVDEVQIQKNIMIETFDDQNSNNYNVENIITEDELDYFSPKENEITQVEQKFTVQKQEEQFQEAFSDEFLDALDEINLQNANVDSPEIVGESVKEDEPDDTKNEMESLVNESVEIAFDEVLNEPDKSQIQDETTLQEESPEQIEEENINKLNEIEFNNIEENVSPELYDKDEDEFNVMNEIENELNPQYQEETTDLAEETEPSKNPDGYELKLVEQPILEGGIEQFDLDGPLDDDTLKYTHDYIETVPDEPETTSSGSEADSVNKFENKSDTEFSEGDTVQHEKYGKGTVLQVVEYSNKTLLQIDFAKIGKRLLDPNMSGIKKI